MEIKNRIIKIFDTKYKLMFVDSIKSDNEDNFIVGETRSSIYEIKVCTKGKDGKPLSKDLIKQILIHELIHAILNEGQYLAYSDDEPLVEWLSRCINSLINQKVI